MAEENFLIPRSKTGADSPKTTTRRPIVPGLISSCSSPASGEHEVRTGERARPMTLITPN